jgi:hypothetical protein
VSQGSANIVVRERSTRESLDLAFPFVLRLGGARYLMLAAATQLPLFAATLALTRKLSFSWVGMWVIAVPLAAFSQGLFTVAAGELMFEKELRLRRVLGKFLRRIVPYTVALLLTRLTVLLVVLIPILPPIVWARTLFIPEVILLEGASVMEGISRATRIATASRRSMVELLFWIAVTLAFGVVAAEALGRGLFEYTLQFPLDSGSLYDDGGSGYAAFGLFAALPIAATLRFLSYIDGRARRDGWDVQVKMQRIVHLEEEAA